MKTTSQWRPYSALFGRSIAIGLSVLCALLVTSTLYAQPTAKSGADPARGAQPDKAITPDTGAPVVKVSAALSNETPTFGDRIDVIVTLRYPKSVRAFFPPRPDLRPLLSLPDQPGSTERKQQGDETIEVITIPVLAVKSGLNRTPAVEVPWHRVTASGGAGQSG
ncbi:MAG TPA: hypothetical protein DCQ06_01375, partial [Myxococcales bacterium]|nr:hypothetical protein [Myxococcales bacterium]